MPSVTPIRPVITHCTHCDTAVIDGTTTVTVTVAKETWHDGSVPTIDVEDARAALIFCLACAQLFNFDDIAVARKVDPSMVKENPCIPFVDGPWKGGSMDSSLTTFEVETGSDEIANPLTLCPPGIERTRYFRQLKADVWVWSVEVPRDANELLADEARQAAAMLADEDGKDYRESRLQTAVNATRYASSVAAHFLTGKLTARHAMYALRTRPIAVASKGKVWVIDPGFTG